MSTDEQLRALASVRLTWAPTPDEVWEAQQPLHVPGMHGTAMDMILDAFRDAKTSTSASPLGVVVQGQAGVGKTHLLGYVREQIQQDGGYFFLVKMLDAVSFWKSTLFAMLEDLGRPMADHETQLRRLLWELANVAGVSRVQRRAIIGESELDRATLDAFITGLFAADSQLSQQCRRTARALVLYAGALDLRDIGESYLLGQDESTTGERADWGVGSAAPTHQEIARDLSRLLALTGPTVLAVDQFDTLLNPQHAGADDTGSVTRPTDNSYEDFAHGLMGLRETFSRTVPVLSCLPTAWVVIDRFATATVRDRFRVCPTLSLLPSPQVAQDLIRLRLERAYSSVGFTAPYPTWPVTGSVFDEALDYTPRRLLQSVDRHIRACLDNGAVAEMTDLTTPAPEKREKPPTTVDHAGDFAVLDARFAQLQATASIDGAFDHTVEDLVIPPLLGAGLDAWIRESGADDDVYGRETPSGTKPALHARMLRTLDEETEQHVHWAFRAIGSTHHTAAVNRLQKSCTAVGLTSGIPGRNLIVLRNQPWPNGEKTRAIVAEFEQAGGRVCSLSVDDARVFAALRELLEQNPEHLDAWLRARRPAHETTLLTTALGDEPEVAFVRPTAADSVTDSPEPEPVVEEQVSPHSNVEPVENNAASIPLGRTIAMDTEVRVDLEALRKHTAIFAGSGSGKTVLIRRIVEEFALQGVSSIVLDPNNDLARLGSEWPADSRPWSPGDRAKADEYLENTEVVVWTPRRQNGRPLSFQPLPDYARVRDDADEFDASVESAVAALAPRANAAGKSANADKARAVLKQALEYFGEGPGGTLDTFVALLEDLPEDISNLRNATKIAADLAENLKASIANDPLFGGRGTAADPGTLLEPSPGYRARVSVVNLSGLPSDDQRQGFVNQLQMALIAWVKKNPAGDRPLGALFVMDEAQNFAPAGGFTACTQSTLALASQARKYGLGLVFATQAPKGLNNKIPGNAATQFYGLLNSPAQIQAAQEMARVKGGTVPDIGKLPAGQFYAAVEGASFRKIAAPLCLTHHPKSPPTEEEVLELAATMT
jgi:hypothetical protein